MAADTPIPLRIHREDHRLLITWPGDRETSYPGRELRLACQCAECRDEFTGRRLLDPKTVAADLRIDQVALVGGYGIRIHWSDGHQAGIYTYEMLYRLAKTNGEP